MLIWNSPELLSPCSTGDSFTLRGLEPSLLDRKMKKRGKRFKHNILHCAGLLNVLHFFAALLLARMVMLLDYFLSGKDALFCIHFFVFFYPTKITWCLIKTSRYFWLKLPLGKKQTKKGYGANYQSFSKVKFLSCYQMSPMSPFPVCTSSCTWILQ